MTQHRLYSHQELRQLLVDAKNQANNAQRSGEKLTWRRAGKLSLGAVVAIPMAMLLLPSKATGLLWGVGSWFAGLLILAALQPGSTDMHSSKAQKALKLFDEKNSRIPTL